MRKVSHKNSHGFLAISPVGREKTLALHNSQRKLPITSYFKHEREALHVALL